MKYRTGWVILLAMVWMAACTQIAAPAPNPTQPGSAWIIPTLPQAPTGGKTHSDITVYPKESAEILINPGKGWVLYSPFTDKPDEIWSVAAVCYDRLSWSQIEPEEGSFQWSVLDDNIQICAARGKQFAFGIIPANSDSDHAFVTPEWVFAAGAKSTPYQEKNGNTVQAPVWNDPVYMNKMQGLINALANHYDGDPHIAYIDARNCGNFGEWHSFGCSELSDADKTALVDPWKVFKQTPILVPTNNDKAQVQAVYGVDTYHFGIRRDCSEKYPNAAIYAYDKSPAVSEWCSSYELLKSCQGLTKVCWSANVLVDYMNKSRFSYDNLGQWQTDSISFYADNTNLVREWANKMGYWFKITRVTLPVNLGNGATETLSFDVRNDGVAPIYVNKNTSYVRLALLDSGGQIVAISDPLPGINPFSWKPGNVSTVTATFSFPNTPQAVSLAIGLFSSPSATAPDIKLGNVGVLPNNWFPIQGELQP